MGGGRPAYILALSRRGQHRHLSVDMQCERNRMPCELVDSSSTAHVWSSISLPTHRAAQGLLLALFFSMIALLSIGSDLTINALPLGPDAVAGDVVSRRAVWLQQALRFDVRRQILVLPLLARRADPLDCEVRSVQILHVLSGAAAWLALACGFAVFLGSLESELGARVALSFLCAVLRLVVDVLTETAEGLRDTRRVEVLCLGHVRDLRALFALGFCFRVVAMYVFTRATWGLGTAFFPLMIFFSHERVSGAFRTCSLHLF